MADWPDLKANWADHEEMVAADFNEYAVRSNEHSEAINNIPNLEIGTVGTSFPGEDASAEIVAGEGEESDQRLLNLIIPRGEQGPPGPVGNLLTFKGPWDASTNTPELADGVGDIGDSWVVEVGATVDLGSGPIAFSASDWAVYNGYIWMRSTAQSSAIAEAIDNLIAGAPGALDTLNELAAALGDDASFATTVTNSLAAKAQALTATAVKTTAYTAAAGDLVPVDATSAGVTVTLPTAPADKTLVAIKKIDASTNVVTVARGGTSTFNKSGGSTSLTLSVPFQAITVQYSAGIWYVIGGDLPSITGQLNITDYGAVGDAVALTDAVMTSGSAVLTSVSNPFTPVMVGKTVLILGAGAAGATLSTTVASYQNAGQVTLSATASVSISAPGGPNVNGLIGTDNSTAFSDAFTAAAAAATAASTNNKRWQNVPAIYVPNGNYLVTTGVPALQNAGHSLAGAGSSNTKIWYTATNTAFLQMGTFNASPANAWYGIAPKLKVSALTLQNPVGMSSGYRTGYGIQDNGSGELFLDNVIVAGFKSGVYATSGSDFTRFGPNVYFSSCDVGVYMGPGGEQVILQGVDFYNCAEGFVNEGAGQGAFYGCSFEGNSTSDITYDSNNSGLTRAGLAWNVPGAQYYGNWVHSGCWFETLNNGHDNSHHILIKNTGLTPGWNGLAFRDIMLVSGGTQAGGGTNSFINDLGTVPSNPEIDNLYVLGNRINAIYRYSGTSSTFNPILKNYSGSLIGTISPFMDKTNTAVAAGTVIPGVLTQPANSTLAIDKATLTNSTLTTPKIGQINDTNGNEILELNPIASAVNYLRIQNSATANPLYIRALGTDATVNLNLMSKGSSGVVNTYDGTGFPIAQFAQGAASAANYWVFNNSVAATGGLVAYANGSDTDINLVFRSKGIGNVRLQNGSSNTIALFTGVATTPNYLSFTAAVSGSPPAITAVGGDTNVSVNLVSKGTGTVQANGVPIQTRTTPLLLTTASTLGAVSGNWYIILVGTGGAPTLPTAVGNSALYTIKNTTATTKTVSTTSSQTIDGAASLTLGAYSSVDVVSDNANWWII